MLLCDGCFGSGEGRYEGERCRHCKGEGVEQPEEDEECHWSDHDYVNMSFMHIRMICKKCNKEKPGEMK